MLSLVLTASESSEHRYGSQRERRRQTLDPNRAPRMPRPDADLLAPPTRHVLRVYVSHYNEHRPQRALELRPPESTSPITA